MFDKLLRNGKLAPIVSQLAVEKWPVSLVIITLNEADGIARAIRSADFCQDCVVLDSGSTDGTVEIATALGARVYVETFRGFRDQKARAVELANCDWVLSLDGDEEVSPELRSEMIQLLSSIGLQPKNGLGASTSETTTAKNGIAGARCPRLTWTLGRWIRHGGWYPDKQLRLFHRKLCGWTGGTLHELVRPIQSPDKGSEALRVVELKSDLWHYPFPRHSVQVETNNRYSGLGAQHLSQKGKRFSLFMLVLKPISKWIECYLIKRGFLDGLPGFIIAVGAAYSMFLKYVKLWEIEAEPAQKPADSDSARR